MFVKDVARYVVYYYNYNGWAISNLKLQKILYFLQADFLVNEGEPCFDEEIEAWDYGPVVPEIYHAYKFYGGNSIPCYEEGFGGYIFRKPRVDKMLIKCKPYSASQLVQATHAQKPWIDAFHKGCGTVISKGSIRDYFLERKRQSNG